MTCPTLGTSRIDDTVIGAHLYAAEGFQSLEGLGRDDRWRGDGRSLGSLLTGIVREGNTTALVAVYDPTWPAGQSPLLDPDAFDEMTTMLAPIADAIG